MRTLYLYRPKDREEYGRVARVCSFYVYRDREPGEQRGRVLLDGEIRLDCVPQGVAIRQYLREAFAVQRVRLTGWRGVDHGWRS